MNLENNWRQKSIENLEKENWGEISSDGSSIVIRAMKLRKTPLEFFSTDDIRFMIGQEIGLKYILILAIELLKKDIMTEGNYYKGDLLNSIFLIKKENWKDITEHWHTVDLLIKDKINQLRNAKPRLLIDDFYSNKPN